MALTVSFSVTIVSPFFRAVIVTCHMPPEPRSPLPSYNPPPLSVPLMTVFISAIFIDGIAGMKKMMVTSALGIGCPVFSVSLTRTVLVPFFARVRDLWST